MCLMTSSIVKLVTHRGHYLFQIKRWFQCQWNEEWKNTACKHLLVNTQLLMS